MLLNTFPFIFFFLAFCIIYWRIPKQFQWVLIVLAGYCFIGFWEPKYMVLMVVTTGISYAAAFKIHSSKHKKLYLWLAITFHITILFAFKYINFFTGILQSSFSFANIHVSFPQFRWIAPIGLSFYTFQILGYLIDVYRGNIKPEKHFGHFAAFCCFFPQISAGPIERYETLMPQIKSPHPFHYQHVSHGLKLFTFGLFKKMVIADNLALSVDQIFGNLPLYKGMSLIIAVIFFSWQLYADFSGYTDMSRGIAEIMGFNLRKNFNSPYFATSIQDFWRRWHMSLSQWFRDYLYIPLGGSRKGNVHTFINGVIVFTVCGLWHGASWNYVIWGALHGTMLGIERIIKLINKNRFAIPALASIPITYTTICFTWIFFRAATIPDALYIIRYAFSGMKNFIIPQYYWATLLQIFKMNMIELSISMAAIIGIVAIEMYSYKFSVNNIIQQQHIVVRYLLYSLVLFAILQMRNASIQQFIYVRF